ncbi:MAG: phosphoribosyl-ATP diphosphatase [Eubacteriales bacterium]|nr:phosphoribosyl-ATP diphosphatase [Eubacteriales bacterium]
MKEIDALYAMTAERKVHPREGSYTNYLFDKGLEKILKKVGEEATEVILAAMKSDREELINEMGDLLYHLVVLMAEAGISPADVDEELARRARKTGNLKVERKPVTRL